MGLVGWLWEVGRGYGDEEGWGGHGGSVLDLMMYRIFVECFGDFDPVGCGCLDVLCW